MPYRFMIIEDDEIFNELNEKLLNLSGIAKEVIIFPMATDGLDYLHKCVADSKSIPDFLLLDLRMPLMNGFEFLQKLHRLPQEKLRPLEIYLLSSSLEDEDIKNSLTYPLVKGFFSKPLNLNIIQEIVKKSSIQ